MSGIQTHLCSTKPKLKRFKRREQRDAYFRALDRRTDRKARHNRKLWVIDQARIMAAIDEARIRAGLYPLPSQPDAQQAGR